jgi:hypothetical protein
MDLVPQLPEGEEARFSDFHESRRVFKGPMEPFWHP